MEPRASLASLEPPLHIFWFWHLPAPDLFTLSSFLISLNLQLCLYSYFHPTPTFCLTLVERLQKPRGLLEASTKSLFSPGPIHTLISK